MSVCLNPQFPARVRCIDPVIAPVVVMDALHEVTAGTPFDHPDRFDPLLEDLILWLRSTARDLSGACAPSIADSLDTPAQRGAGDRQKIVVAFFRSLPPHMRVRQILSGLEGR
ncbi:hypothetical protein [Komagataeibacter xylinus]|uniref:hypothetical protein n=1 Tax=Komagataeibacter xylinus TaxID=28448 RepID=UPI00280C3439|nr:hypothetical protein [Komagataeibacter xylinus]